MAGHGTPMDPVESNSPTPAREPRRTSVARVIAIVATVFAGVGLFAASHTYVAHNSGRCAGGLGWIGPGLLNIAGLTCTWPLAGGIAVYALFLALRRRQMVWAAGLLAAAAASVIISIGSTSALSHQAVGAVLGAGCSWFWPWVTAFVALMPVVLTGLIYILRQTPSA